MRVAGIIAEYNPFHNGHLYHLKECKRMAQADAAVIVMSGNFTQRGEPAVLNKWIRSRLAAECGADLVLELPFAYSVSSAEYFAKGGVGILSGLGCVTHLAFGAEKGELKDLQAIGRILAEEPEAYRTELKKSLSQGQSYAKAREIALQACVDCGRKDLTLTPNNILAVEYIKQLILQKSSINPIMVKRKGSGYFDLKPQDNIASATAIRSHISKDERKKYVPFAVEKELKQQPDLCGYFALVQNALLRSSKEELASLLSVSEGLENRLKAQVRKAASLDELVARVKSKRYPETRIRRILCQAVVGLTPFEDCFYARVLAAGKKGTKLLKEIKKTAAIPVITNINKEPELPPIMKYDILASDLYNLLAGADLYKNSDYVAHPYIQPIE